jgi:hypothetical protein
MSGYTASGGGGIAMVKEQEVRDLSLDCPPSGTAFLYPRRVMRKGPVKAVDLWCCCPFYLWDRCHETHLTFESGDQSSAMLYYGGSAFEDGVIASSALGHRQARMIAFAWQSTACYHPCPTWRCRCRCQTRRRGRCLSGYQNCLDLHAEMDLG